MVAIEKTTIIIIIIIMSHTRTILFNEDVGSNIQKQQDKRRLQTLARSFDTTVMVYFDRIIFFSRSSLQIVKNRFNEFCSPDTDHLGGGLSDGTSGKM